MRRGMKTGISVGGGSSAGGDYELVEAVQGGQRHIQLSHYRQDPQDPIMKSTTMVTRKPNRLPMTPARISPANSLALGLCSVTKFCCPVLPPFAHLALHPLLHLVHPQVPLLPRVVPPHVLVVRRRQSGHPRPQSYTRLNLNLLYPTMAIEKEFKVRELIRSSDSNPESHYQDS